LFKIIPVKKQGKYNLNVQLQDLGYNQRPDPIHFKGLLQGNLGHSMVRGKVAVDELIIGRLPVTIELGLMSIVIGLVIALPVGIYSAVRQDTAADYLGRSVAIIGLATPNFWQNISNSVFNSTFIASNILVVSPLSVVPLKIWKNNCNPGETHRETPSLCKIPTLDRANLAEDRYQHSRGGLSIFF
jgi:hypothetical protein